MAQIPRYSAKTIDSSVKAQQRLIMRPAEVPIFDPNAAMVSFDLPPRRELDQEDIPSYRGITRAETEEEDPAVIEADLRGFSTFEQDRRKRTAETEQYLREHPEDIERWIAYSTLHREGTDPLKLGIDASQKPATRASAEVTMSVLSRALEATPENGLSPILHIAYIHAAENVWTAEQVSQRWQNVLRVMGEDIRAGAHHAEIGLFEIWLAYLDWREGQGLGSTKLGKLAQAGGGVDEVIESYLDCLENIKRSELGDPQTREENQLHIFVRTCLFMKQAGYAERGLACFQAMMEITFFKPASLRASGRPTPASWFTETKRQFEEFWDADLPRIGEAFARGWANAESMPISTSEPPIEKPRNTPGDVFEQWHEAERHAEHRDTRPGRASNLDADDDDPFHVVLFADVEPFLFPILQPDVRLQLVYAFLLFLGLPFTQPFTSTSSPSNEDPRLHWALSYNDAARTAFWPSQPSQKALPWQVIGGEAMEPEVRSSLTPFRCPVKSWAIENDTLFARPDMWFPDLPSTDLQPLEIEFIRNCFRLLQPLINHPSFALASLAFESAVSVKGYVFMIKPCNPFADLQSCQAVQKDLGRRSRQSQPLGWLCSVGTSTRQPHSSTSGIRNSLASGSAIRQPA